jgi:hypothetical protein
MKYQINIDTMNAMRLKITLSNSFILENPVIKFSTANSTGYRCTALSRFWLSNKTLFICERQQINRPASPADPMLQFRRVSQPFAKGISKRHPNTGIALRVDNLFWSITESLSFMVKRLYGRQHLSLYRRHNTNLCHNIKEGVVFLQFVHDGFSLKGVVKNIQEWPEPFL